MEKTFQTTRNSNGIILKRGDNFGDFNFGSTIVLVFEAPDNLEFNVKPGEVVRLGQSLCHFATVKDVDSNAVVEENESTALSSNDSDGSSTEDEERLFIDPVALDAAIADANSIADQEVISNNPNNSEDRSLTA